MCKIVSPPHCACSQKNAISWQTWRAAPADSGVVSDSWKRAGRPQSPSRPAAPAIARAARPDQRADLTTRALTTSTLLSLRACQHYARIPSFRVWFRVCPCPAVHWWARSVVTQKRPIPCHHTLVKCKAVFFVFIRFHFQEEFFDRLPSPAQVMLGLREGGTFASTSGGKNNRRFVFFFLRNQKSVFSVL